MTTHTPGPWISRMNGAICSDPTVHGEHYRTIAHLSESGFIDTPEKAANARLIAAAPDMLAALKAIAWWLDFDVDAPAGMRDLTERDDQERAVRKLLIAALARIDGAS